MSAFGGFGTPAPGQQQQQPGTTLFGGTPTPAFGAPASAPNPNPFGLAPAPAGGGFGGGFGQQPQQQQQQTATAFTGFGAPATTGTQTRSPFATSTTGGFGQPAQQQSSLFGATPAPAPATNWANAFKPPQPQAGGGLFGMAQPQAGMGMGGFGQPQQQGFGGQPTAQQQEQQRQLQQKQFWEQEINMLRDSYTPQVQQPQQLGMVQPPPRSADYKFAFRVLDTTQQAPGGQPREVMLSDRKLVQAKLEYQRAEMQRVQEHLERLGVGVQSLDGQAKGAKERLARCREAQMGLTNRFLVVLQRIQVMHHVNKPFDAREKEMRDRLEVMVGRLEDAIRTLNEVAGVVDEEEADLREQPRRELTCKLASDDLALLQQALEKQQEGLDYLTKALARDFSGVQLLAEKLEQSRRE